MVVTFLVDEDFGVSAGMLNWQRLGKQRVEAKQILTIIEDLNYLGDLFSYPYHPDINLQSWIQTITKYYKNLPFCIVIRDVPMALEKISLAEYQSIAKPKKNHKIIPLSFYRRYINPTDHLINLNYALHPCVRMWFHHPEALKLYINAHINEWIARGYRNTMKIYDCDDNPPRPSWTYDINIHHNHRAILLAKELTRSEAPWYQLKQEFMEVGESTEYIWPV